MTDRIIDLSRDPARLSVRTGLLVIERREQPEITVPFDDVAVLIGTHRQLSFTQTVFSELMEAGGVFVACDHRGMPAGLMLPMEGNHVQAERFAAQAAAPLPTRKRLWQGVVRAKVTGQARALRALHGDDFGLMTLARQVGSGDPRNVEGQAARRYWTKLFADEPRFVRDRDKPGRNTLLNYGYAVLRGIAARAVCGAGLHPSFGIHHHNRYDAFLLADDLMEPFRPLVDLAVVALTAPPLHQRELDPETKRALIAALLEPVEFQGEQRSLFDALARMAASIAKVYLGLRKGMDLPEWS